MKPRLFYKTMCLGCGCRLKSYYKYCAKCGTFNVIDWKETLIFNFLLIGMPLVIIVLIGLVGH